MADEEAGAGTGERGQRKEEAEGRLDSAHSPDARMASGGAIAAWARHGATLNSP